MVISTKPVWEFKYISRVFDVLFKPVVKGGLYAVCAMVMVALGSYLLAACLAFISVDELWSGLFSGRVTNAVYSFILVVFVVELFGDEFMAVVGLF